MENTTDVEDVQNSTVSDANDFQTNAKSFLMYQIAHYLHQYYFPVFIPVGIIRNGLSFLVMIQPHNRHMSMSLYLASIAVVDTIILSIGLVTHLATQENVEIPPNVDWYCRIANATLFAAFLCSNMLLVSMTFERFYSIVRPHKAASFNTVKRAKITILCIIIISIVYNIPHLFISSHENWQCIPYGSALDKSYGLAYYWFSFIVNYALPFVLLLGMNSVIIHKIRGRSVLITKRDNCDGNDGQASKRKSSENQIFAILLLVTFAFLILTTPGYMLFLFVMLVNFFATPKLFASYHLFYSVAQKLHFTNHGINFFLYVISGQKFRKDLLNLFRRQDQSALSPNSKSTENSSIQ